MSDIPQETILVAITGLAGSIISYLAGRRERKAVALASEGQAAAQISEGFMNLVQSWESRVAKLEQERRTQDEKIEHLTEKNRVQEDKIESLTLTNAGLLSKVGNLEESNAILEGRIKTLENGANGNGLTGVVPRE